MSGYDITHSAFSPANFDEAESGQPIAVVFDVSGTGNATPYTTAVNGIIQNHVGAIKDETATRLPKATDWKKRLRDFLSRKNSDLLDFLNLSVPSHPTLGKGDTIIRRFSMADAVPNSGAVKNMVADISGADVFGEIGDALKALRTENAITDFTEQIKYVYEQYRKAGDDILRCETSMKVKLETFDKIQKNVVNLLELDPTTSTEELMQVAEKYLGDIFENNKIRSTYVELIGAYRRFVIVREFVQMLRVVQSNENEPLCTICLANPVGYCLTPCGHTYCEQCLRRQPASCFMCRTPVGNRIKLFFG